MQYYDSASCSSSHRHEKTGLRYHYQHRQPRLPRDRHLLEGTHDCAISTTPLQGTYRSVPIDDLRSKLGPPRSMSSLGNRGTVVQSPPINWKSNPDSAYKHHQYLSHDPPSMEEWKSTDKYSGYCQSEGDPGSFNSRDRSSSHDYESDFDPGRDTRLSSSDWTPCKVLYNDLSTHDVQQTFENHLYDKRHRGFKRAIRHRANEHRKEYRIVRDDKIRYDRGKQMFDEVITPKRVQEGPDGFRMYASYELECQKMDGKEVGIPLVRHPTDLRKRSSLARTSYSVAPDLRKTGFQIDAHFAELRNRDQYDYEQERKKQKVSN